MNFAALNVIMDVDDIYTNCVTNLPFREILQYDLPKWKVSAEEFNTNIKTACPAIKTVNMLLRVLEFSYSVIYYYFIPFFTILLTFIFNNDQPASDLEEYLTCCNENRNRRR